MYLERHFKNTIKQSQSCSEAQRQRNGSLSPVKRLSIGLGCRPLTCQWIETNPTRHEIRTLGTDAFKCGAGVKDGSVYCDCHHARAYIAIKPLTDEPAP